MKNIKITALILAIALCLPLIASCADEGVTDYTRQPEESGSADNSEFADADYNNEDFTFLYIQHPHTGKDYYGGDYLYAETYTGDTVNDAVYARNLAVEEKYKVVIKQDLQENGDPASFIQKKIMAGEFDHDVIYGWAYKLGACIPENFFADFNSLSNVDFTKEYWNPSTTEDLTINDKLYLGINDITMSKMDWADLLFYNKGLAEDYNIEKEFGSFYDLVMGDKWTLDVFLNMVKSISTDLDGDGNIGKDDVYGLLIGDPDDGSWACHSSGIDTTVKNEDGSYSLNFYSERLLNIIGKVNEVVTNNKVVKDYTDIWNEGGMEGSGNYGDQFEYARSYFATDHAMFCLGSPYLTCEFRNMSSDYGIIPMPKADENQDSYYSYVTPLASIFTIPATPRNDMDSAGPERTGTILEYMAYKSNEVLLPEYYDTLLKGQRLDSDEDSQMLDVIRNTIRYDFAATVGIEIVGNTVKTMFAKPASATSSYKRTEKKLQKALDDYYAEVLLLETKNKKEQ